MDSPAIFLKNFQAAQRGKTRQLWAPYEPFSSSSSLEASVTGARGAAHIHRERKIKSSSAGKLKGRTAAEKENAEQKDPCFWWAKVRTSNAWLCTMVCPLSLRDSPRRDFTGCRCWDPAAVFPKVSPFLLMGLVVVHLCAAKGRLI